MPKFTPGPWHRHLQVRDLVVDQSGDFIAGAHERPHDPTERERYANAQLLAAAPELYLMVLRLAEANEAATSDMPNRLSERSGMLAEVGTAARQLLNQLNPEESN